MCALVMVSSLAVGPEPVSPESRPSVPRGDYPLRQGPRIPPMPLIRRYAWLTAAVLCSDRQLQNWDCRSCRPLGNTIRFIRGLENEEFGTRGFVGIDEANKRILVVFRATENAINARQSRNIAQVPFEPARDNSVRVTRGPLSAMESLEGQMLEALRPMVRYPGLAGYKLAFVGHSLGSTLASLSAARVKVTLNIPSDRIEVYAYAMPRSGNRDFAEWYNHLDFAVARVVNHNDLIPHIIGGNGRLVHIKTELWVTGPFDNERIIICNTTTLEDPYCSKSIPRSRLSYDPHYYLFDVSYLGERC
ncbi:hypothetical protein DSO57_1013814 [Entomophthora muscae]|uniref:Uncharacterized protein n=1 Tax=Entomophthora muscae TaxID=34485 RepID=A0ACC2TT97_9FUNG|nr:hypothetical protein DSO57_1013814 [Entomophthora muscae]